MSTQLYQIQDTPRAVGRSVTMNHSRAAGRTVTSNHSAPWNGPSSTTTRGPGGSEPGGLRDGGSDARPWPGSDPGGPGRAPRKGNELEIRFPVDVSERARALRVVSDAYISRGYMDAYVKGLQPPRGDSTQVLVAVSDGTVIGTVSAVRRSKGALPTEQYFGLTNLDERSSTVIEIGRLAVANGTGSLRAMAFIGLIAAVQLWADRNGVKRALATVKPTLRRRLAMLGITSELAAGPERLIPEAIPPELRGYFLPQSAAQRPVAVFISFDEMRASILGHLSAANGHLTICPEIGSPASCAA